MGKAVRWLKGFLGIKKDKEFPEKKVNKRWGFGRLSSDSRAAGGQFPGDLTPVVAGSPWPVRSYLSDSEKEQTKHAIAVAAATAAAADAAMAAAQAAAAVVKLTRQGKGGGGVVYGRREKWAAVKIQTFFRGYLARKALRALKGIVKLQALVRGYLVRKKAAATLYSMQALIRAQAAVRSQRVRLSLSNDPRFVADIRARKAIERFENGMDESPRTVEIDTYNLKSSRSGRRISTVTLDSGDDQMNMNSPRLISTPPPCRIPGRLSIPDRRHLCDYDWSFLGDDCKFPTAHNTPRARGSGRFNAPPTPANSVSGESLFRQHTNCPSYMANTQSFNAKLRSQSAPKQRPETGQKKKKKRLSLTEIMAARSSFSGVRTHKSRFQVDREYGF